MTKRWIAIGLLFAAAVLGACSGKNNATPTDITEDSKVNTGEGASESGTQNGSESNGQQPESADIAVDPESFGTVTEDGRYITANGKMSFVLPEGFKKTESKDVVDFVSAEYPLRADNIHFTTTENTGGLSFYTKEILEAVYAENESYRDVAVTAVEELTIGGAPAVKVTMNFTMEETPIVQTQVYIEYGDMVYHIYYAKITDLEVDFDTCLSTVTFYE